MCDRSRLKQILAEVIEETLASLSSDDPDEVQCGNAWYVLNDKVGVSDDQVRKIRTDPKLGPIQAFLEYFADAVGHGFPDVIGKITLEEGWRITTSFLNDLKEGREPELPPDVQKHCSYDVR